MRYVLILCAVFTFSGCKAVPKSGIKETSSAGDWRSFVPPRAENPNLCTVLRGNGQYIFSHWASMARILEHYGMIEGVVGGSSGAITTFLYESVYSNPAVWSCGNANTRCSEEEAAQRAALLLKSMGPFFDLMANRAAGKLFAVLPTLMEGFQTNKVFTLMSLKNWKEAASAAYQVMTSGEVSGLINPELLTSLKDPERRQLALEEIKAVVGALEWKAVDPKIFLRSGIMNFNGLGTKVMAIGDFYAGKDEASLEGMKGLLDACVTKDPATSKWNSSNKLWQGVAITGSVGVLQTEEKWFGNEVSGTRKSCGEFFNIVANKFLDKAFPTQSMFSKTPVYKSQRGAEPIGKYLPALVMTSIIEGQAANDQFRHAYVLYANQRQFRGLGIDFNDVKVGFWGKQSDLTRVRTTIGKSSDALSQKFLDIGESTWESVVAVGAQEPGLGSVLCHINQGEPGPQRWGEFSQVLREEKNCRRSSAGAWINHHELDEMRSLGCKKVIYVTRQGEESSFITGAAQLLGATKEDISKLYLAGSPTSMAQKTLAEFDAVWCTDWAASAPGDFRQMIRDGYNDSYMLSNDPTFLNGKFANVGPYPRSAKHADRRLFGCSPGVTSEVEHDRWPTK